LENWNFEEVLVKDIAKYRQAKVESMKVPAWMFFHEQQIDKCEAYEIFLENRSCGYILFLPKGPNEDMNKCILEAYLAPLESDKFTYFMEVAKIMVGPENFSIRSDDPQIFAWARERGLDIMEYSYLYLSENRWDAHPAPTPDGGIRLLKPTDLEFFAPIYENESLDDGGISDMDVVRKGIEEGTHYGLFQGRHPIGVLYTMPSPIERHTSVVTIIDRTRRNEGWGKFLVSNVGRRLQLTGKKLIITGKYDNEASTKLPEAMGCTKLATHYLAGF
jgi:hypothetical protein